MVGGFREGRHGHGGREGLREERVRSVDRFTALERAVADEQDRAFGKLGGETVRIDDDGFRLGELPAVRREDGGVNLHPAGIHHGHDGLAAVRDDAQPVRLLHENIQRAGGKERDSGPETEAFGRGNAYAESRVGSRPPAHADSFQILDSQPFFIQYLFHVGRGEGGLHAGLPANAEGRHGAVLRERGGELGGRCFDEEDAGHAIA